MKSSLSLIGLLALIAAPALAADSTDSGDAVADARRGRAHLPEPSLEPNIPEYDLNTQGFVFPTGLTIYMQPDHSEPMVAITTVFDRGSTSDPPGKEGIAHFVEHFWFKSRHLGDGDNEGPRTWDVLSEMGCGLNASTSDDWTNYMTICPSSALKPLMRLASLRMTDTVANTRPEEVDSEREVIRNELRMRMENSGGEVLRYIYDRVYGPDHPYHRLTIGTHGSLDNITHEDIVQFTRDHYRPENATIVIVGDFDPQEASSLIFENFAPELLHPDLRPEHLRWFPKEGVDWESIDPENPDPDKVMWTAIDPASDPESPDPFPLQYEIRQRVEEFGLEPQPAYNREVGVFDAPIDDRTVVVGWSAPGGYRGQDTIARVAANMAGNQIMQGVWDDPRVRRMRIGDEVLRQPEVGCWASSSKENTTILCFMGITENAPGERMTEVMIDQLPEMWNPEILQIPELRTQIDGSFYRAKLEVMRDTLLSLDTVAGLYGARATDIAMHAHFTGRATYHSDVLNEMAQFNADEAIEFARTWMTRQRAAAVVLNPLPLEDRALDSSESDYAGATAENDLVLSALDPDSITPDFIRGEVDLPDMSQLVDTTLPNGMRVVILPHGEAPLVETHVITPGGSGLDLLNMDGFAESFLDDPRYEFLPSGQPVYDPLQFAGAWADTGTDGFSTWGLRAPAGSLDAALWMLRTRLDESHPAMSGMKKYVKDARKSLIRSWKRQSYWQQRVVYDQMGQDAPAFHFRSWDDVEALGEITPDQIRAYLGRKYQPGNATLLIVGRIDPQAALAQAETYFGSWSPPRAGDAAIEVPSPAPILEHEPRIFVFDDEAKTQTQVDFACRLTDGSVETDAARAVVSQMISDHLFETLRAQEGVTYGAYAYQEVYVGGTGVFNMGSLVQNDAVDLAANTFIAVARDAAAGNLPLERFRPVQLSQARKYVLGQQSVGQIATRLARPIGAMEPWERITEYPDRLAGVEPAQMAGLLSECPDSMVITMVGPVDVIEERLTAAGLAYEVFDHEAAALELLDRYSPKDAKKLRKAIAKREAAEAEEEAEAEANDTSEESAPTGEGE